MRRSVALALSSTLILPATPLVAGPATAGAHASAVQAPVATGAINGTAQSTAGQTLPNYTVQVRNLQTGELGGTTTSNAAGSFSFTGLSPANYVVEIVDQAGAVVGSSASIAVTTGATVTVTVAATAAAAVAAAGGAAGGIGTALLMTSLASAAGIAGVVAVVKQDASPSR